ncbi:sialidase family protein [Paenibacillus cymbidii]|uniref:sialidase family protein n=1 Tax=Paenibacillus cymbidii TaxID=1639034 RepID=UPI00107FD902|nr:sialidase family protein [Paenibacillus cymbidii]
MTASTIQSQVAEQLCEDSNLHIGPVIELQDGSLFTIMVVTKKHIKTLDDNISSHYVMGRQSFDGGRTWGNPETIVSFTPQPGWIAGTHVLQSREGYIHVFSLRITRYKWESGEFAGDILHTRMDDIHGTNATTQKVECLDRYTGAINSLLQTKSGRIVVPFSTLVRSETGDYSYFVSSTIYSDDEGATWQASNDVAVKDDETYLESGAIEPIVLELVNGSILMLIRTTLGRFFYALSADGGATWSEAKRTAFRSSNSPTSLLRLADDSLLKIWNHCDGHPLHTVISYARQALHAAISDDEGATWHGYREILRRLPDDPADTHLAYPFPTALGTGDVLVKLFSVNSKRGESWNEPLAKMIRFSPSFLRETKLAERFLDGLDAWSTAGDCRVDGLGSTADGGRRLVLTAEAGVPAAACLNFPYGSSGRVRLEYAAGAAAGDAGASGARLVLSERYIDPFHYTNGKEGAEQLREAVLRECAVVALATAAPGADGRAALELAWDAASKELRATDAAGTRTYALADDCGGFSYVTLVADSGSLTVVGVDAESLRGGCSGMAL